MNPGGLPAGYPGGGLAASNPAGINPGSNPSHTAKPSGGGNPSGGNSSSSKGSVNPGVNPVAQNPEQNAAQNAAMMSGNPGDMYQRRPGDIQDPRRPGGQPIGKRKRKKFLNSFVRSKKKFGAVSEILKFSDVSE
jgi:hypothetical protein